MNANQYYEGDDLHGLVSSTSEGYTIGTYELGAKNYTVTTSRLSASGNDRLYCKYYLVQDGEIIAGPVYATDIYAPRSSITTDTETIKGIFTEDDDSIDYAEDLGAQHTTINMELTSLILPNEDGDGEKISYSGRNDVYSFVSNGTTYYYDKSQLDYYDELISAYTEAGIDVQVVLVARVTDDWDEYPKAMTYVDPGQNDQFMAINTSTEKGRKYFTALMEMLASRYSESKSTGYVSDYVLGNEVDYAYKYWRLTDAKNSSGGVGLDIYMEEYERTLRIANNAVKKYASDITVSIPLTHNWTVNGWESLDDTCQDASSDLFTGSARSASSKNSYHPKDMLDWLAERSDARGDFDWGLAGHYLSTNLPQSAIGYYDTGMSTDYYPSFTVTGDYETTRFVTISNMEVIQQYLETDALTYQDSDGNESVRSVYLTETGVASLSTFDEVKEQAESEQAAYTAMLYYKASHMSCIKSVNYYRLQDNTAEGEYTPGLLRSDGSEKPAWEVWKYIDTDKSFEVSDKYLEYIYFQRDGETVYPETWKEAMQVTSTSDANSFDWSVWDTDKITVRSSVDTVERSLEVSADTYSATDRIKVTATGADSDWVGLFKADDVTDGKNNAYSIYWYYVGLETNGVSHASGKTYDIRSQGELNSVRFDDAALSAGEYKIVLFNSAGTPQQTEYITITEADLTAPSLTANKDTYKVGENIITTATGIEDGASYWVGIYDRDDVAESVSNGGVTSIYWYYIHDQSSLHASGSPTILQNTIFQSRDNHTSETLQEGEYTIYLFRESSSTSYKIVQSVDITIAASAPDALNSVTYELDDDTDGYAAGNVTVTYSNDDEAGTDCLLYWGDANGEPLEGYDALAKFELTGNTSTECELGDSMIIPEGAETLIAYAVNDTTKSNEAVVAELPAGCAYDLSGSELQTEFQVVSDLHVTDSDSTEGTDIEKANEHFQAMLEDIQELSPDSAGIFVNGDVADDGTASEYALVKEMYDSVEGLPQMYYGIGNHDWLTGSSDNFLNALNELRSEAGLSKLNHEYYAVSTDECNFIFLGGESGYSGSNWLYADLSDEQLDWFESKLDKFTAEDPDKPIFVFLHQPMYDTVAGSLSGQGWDGVLQEEQLRDILQNYGNVIMFGGHSHWEMNSYRNIDGGTSDSPAYLNTAAVGYLWSSYGDVNSSGWFTEGSNGYFIKVYDDKILVQGRDFENGTWLPSATYVLQRQDLTVTADGQTSPASMNVDLADGLFTVKAESATGAKIKYTTTDSDILTVDSKGNVVPQETGTANIIVTAQASDTNIINRHCIEVTVTSDTLTAVTGLTTSEATATSINVSWNASGSPTGYEVTNNTTGEVFLTSATSIALTGLASSTDFSITVRPYVNIEGDCVYGPSMHTKGTTLAASTIEGAKFTVGSGASKATYTVLSSTDKTVAYTKAMSAKSTKSITVPATVTCDGVTYKVVAIGSKAFLNRTKLTSVKIGSNTKTIYAQAFKGCGKLVKVTGGKNVSSIGNMAFKGCKKLTKVGNLNDSTSLKTISAKTFAGCTSLKSFTVGKNVTKIGKGAFKNCTRLTTLTVASKKLAKGTVKGSLKGSKVTKVKVDVGKTAADKKYVKKYAKAFTKANCGKKVTVTR